MVREGQDGECFMHGDGGKERSAERDIYGEEGKEIEKMQNILANGARLLK